MSQVLLLLERVFLPEWRQRRFPDPNHPWRRTFTATYRRKKRIVGWVWCGFGLGILALSSMAGLVTLLLLATFTSFSILDETD